MKGEFKDCPVCGSDRIDINRITNIDADTKTQTWAFCRNCGYRGKDAVGTYDVDEGKREAIRLWNNNAVPTMKQ